MKPLIYPLCMYTVAKNMYENAPRFKKGAPILKSKNIYQSLPDYLKPYNKQVVDRGLGPDEIRRCSHKMLFVYYKHQFSRRPQ